jgi:hypothetical protein
VAVKPDNDNDKLKATIVALEFSALETAFEILACGDSHFEIPLE